MDLLVVNLIQSYQTCRLGTGGMGFNWPGGTWENTPMIVVEAFQIIERIINEYQETKQTERKWNANSHLSSMR